MYFFDLAGMEEMLAHHFWQGSHHLFCIYSVGHSVPFRPLVHRCSLPPICHLVGVQVRWYMAIVYIPLVVTKFAMQYFRNISVHKEQKCMRCHPFVVDTLPLDIQFCKILSSSWSIMCRCICLPLLILINVFHTSRVFFSLSSPFVDLIKNHFLNNINETGPPISAKLIDVQFIHCHRQGFLRKSNFVMLLMLFTFRKMWIGVLDWNNSILFSVKIFLRNNSILFSVKQFLRKRILYCLA